MSVVELRSPAQCRSACVAHNLVVHESALPQGQGLESLTWQILDGVLHP